MVTHISKGADGKTAKRDIDIHEALRSGSMDNNFPVANGDIIFVPRAPLFYIYGEVQRPGAFRLEKDMTVMQAISVGGGLTLRGTERGIRVNRHGPDGKVQNVQTATNELVKENDVIFVKESLF